MALVKRSDNLQVAVSASNEGKPKTNVKVLDEDTYVQSVDKIIQRDFFPELSKLRAQHEYIDAVEHNDVEKLREISVRYQISQTPDGRIETPATFETPSTVQGSPTQRHGATEHEREDLGSETSEQNARNQTGKNSDMSLDRFLANNTSEDNASFEQIMEHAREKHREKYDWLYQKEEEQLHRREQRLALPAPHEGDQLLIEGRPAMVETWTYKNKNALMYTPDGVEDSVTEKIDKQTKAAKEIVHLNTRFMGNPFPDANCSEKLADAAASKTAQLRGKVGVDGQMQGPEETPKVGGFSFVGTPSPVPGVDASPLMTWGSIDGTPFRLDGSDTPKPATHGPVFKMPDPKPREQLGHALAERASRQHREKKREARARAAAMIGKSPKHPNSVDRLNSMSPAAQLLASKKLGIRTGSDRALQASYSPSPIHRGAATPSHTPGRSTPGARTPKTPGESTPTMMTSLTDDLLKLPKRS